jgi:SPW repeat-containing protein
VVAPVPVAAGLADEWWYWALVAAMLLAAAAFSGRYRMLAARARGRAIRRGLVQLPPGRTVDRAPRGFWSDLSWLALAAGLWVGVSPWTWGYDDVDGAIATDVVTGAAVIALSLAAIVFPALWALDLFAGTWLVIAPWIVGYGDSHGPVGLSDTIAGLVICVVATTCLAASQRALRPGEARAIGRIRPR